MSRSVCDVSQAPAGVRSQQGSVREPSAGAGHRGAGAGGAGRDGAPQDPDAGGEAAELGEGAVEALAAALLRDLPLLLLRGGHRHINTFKKRTAASPFILFSLAILTFFLRIASYKKKCN